MNKYIDADKLIAEIERRMKDYNASIEKYYDKQKSIKAERDSWKWAECKWFLNLITSLQQEQPEVDIEKEIAEHAENMPHGEFTHESECVEHEEWAKREFRHFYELGLNARKEE